MSTQLLDSEIRYSKTTRDYDILICNQIVASAPNYSQAELIRSQLLSERIQDGCYATIPEGTPEDDFSDVGPERAPCLDCDGEGRIPSDGSGDQAGGYAETCQECKGSGHRAPRTNPIWPTQLLIGTHDLHILAQTNPAEFRARLAALSDDALKTQAERYALYASILCDCEISEAETLAQFRLAVAVHRADPDERPDPWPDAPHPLMVAADASAESYTAL